MNDAARKEVSGKSKVIPRVGTFVGADGVRGLVDLGAERVSIQFATTFVPEVNEPVWVDAVDGVLRIIGPTTPKPGLGVVLAVDGDFVTVDTAFGSKRMPYLFGQELVAGDVVCIVWSSGAACFKLSTSPDPISPPPPPSGGGSEIKTAEFRAINAGSTDRPPKAARWWTDQPRAGNTTLGAWFYGSRIKDTIPADAVFESLEFYVARVKDYGGAPRFVLHSDQFVGGIPSVSSYTEWDPPDGGYRTPPDAVGWFNALKNGGAWAGVGLNQGGDNIFASLAQDGMSGAIRIRWR